MIAKLMLTCAANNGFRRSVRTRTAYRLFRLLLLLATLLVSWACERQSPAEAEVEIPERIVLVTIDTLRADRLGCYGASWARTPTLDRLAANGVRFANVIAPTPLTQPSHATLFTALDPPQHGMRINGTIRLADHLPTLADRLRASGYQTAGFVGAVILESYYGFGRGFDHFDDRMESPRDRPAVGADARPANAVVDSAIAWLATAPERFFLWVHLYDPHAPYQAPGVLRRFLARTPYDAEISFADSQLGRLIDALEDAWPSHSTLIVVTSDHGESLGEHGEDTHGYGIYDATQHVPLILSGAGVPEDKVVEMPVRLADLAPTVLALADAPPLENVSGQDLRPLWETETSTPRISVLETLATKLHFGWSPLFGVRTERYKYIRAPRVELYDLQSDPGELRNLAAELPDKVADLDRILRERLADPGTVSLDLPDPRRRAQLERLGYLVPEPATASELLEAAEGPDPKDHIKDLSVYRKARTLMRSNQPQAALHELAKIQGRSPYVSNLRADALLAAGKPRLAERHARASLRSGSKDYELHVTLAHALLQQGRFDEAEKVFEDAARLQPAGPRPLLGLGMVAESRGEFDKAEDFYRRASETRIVKPEAHWLLAALYIEKGRQSSAQALLDGLAPELLLMPDAAARLAVAEARAGQRGAALERLAESQKRFPNAPVLARALQMIERESR